MVFNSFLGLFNLQIGVAIMSTSLLSLSLCSFMANMLLMSYKYPFPWGFIVLMNLLIMVNWVTAFVGASEESYATIKGTLICWSAFIFIWILSVAFSMTETGEVYTCLNYRCPESLWMFNNTWHIDHTIRLKQYDYELDYNYVIKEIEKDRYSLKKLMQKDEFNEKVNDLMDHTDVEPRAVKKEKKRTLNQTTITYIVVIITFGILAYAWLMLYGYLQELKCMNKCLEDEYCNDIDKEI